MTLIFRAGDQLLFSWRVRPPHARPGAGLLSNRVDEDLTIDRSCSGLLARDRSGKRRAVQCDAWLVRCCERVRLREPDARSFMVSDSSLAASARRART